MLRMGWDDDLEAIVKSWRTANDWLSASDPVHPHRWQKPAYVNLQKLCGSRLARVPERLGRGDVFGVPLALYAGEYSLEASSLCCRICTIEREKRRIR